MKPCHLAPSPRLWLVIGSLFTLLLAFAHDGLASEDKDTYAYLEKFSSVLHILEQNYVEEIDARKVIEGAIKGMLTALDPHSSYLTPDDFKELQVETKGSFSGIGIEISLRDGILTVVSPIEGTPADKAGLLAGDRILKIDAESTKDMGLMEAVKKLRGPKGSKVTIFIHRQGETKLQKIVLTRDVIPLHSVKAKMLDKELLYLRITNFQAKTSADLADALARLSNKYHPTAMLLDLRNNPGGLLDQAVNVADLFLQEGVIVSTKGRLEEQNMVYRAHGSGPLYKAPMIILVNEGSASASEIVAGALQDHGRALVLGTQTFGKGSVQTILPMPDGAGLRLTIARYYTPNGTSIQATGITPDLIVPRVKPVSKEEAAANEPDLGIIREKDLRHHITNGNGGEQADDTAEPPEQRTTEAGDQEDFLDQDLVARDNQLQTAVLVMKGITVFNRSPREPSDSNLARQDR